MIVLVLILAGHVPSTGEAVEVQKQYQVTTLAECHATGKRFTAAMAEAGKTAGYYCDTRKVSN